jgi:hypothetical protein
MTSQAQIRDALVLAVGATSAAAHAAAPFRFAPRTAEMRVPFRDWCENNPQACFRAFDLRIAGFSHAGGWEVGLERRAAEFELVVAYPHELAIYGADNQADLGDTIESDLTDLVAVVGLAGGSNYPAGSMPAAEATTSKEAGDAVTFGVLRVIVEYQYET